VSKCENINRTLNSPQSSSRQKRNKKKKKNVR